MIPEAYECHIYSKVVNLFYRYIVYDKDKYGVSFASHWHRHSQFPDSLTVFSHEPLEQLKMIMSLGWKAAAGHYDATNGWSLWKSLETGGSNG